MEKDELVLFEDDNIKLEVPVSPEQETVWLSLDQMAELFEKDHSVIGRHVRNIFKEGELEELTSGQILPGSTDVNHRPAKVFNLDVIISVGSVDISNYSHKEKGYSSTKQGEIISYSYAKDIQLTSFPH